jgi:ComEC/Rec2-related protein
MFANAWISKPNKSPEGTKGLKFAPACASVFTTSYRGVRIGGKPPSRVHVCFTTVSACAFSQSFPLRATSAIPARLIIEVYLRENGIAALASTKSANVEVLSGISGSRIELWRSRTHRSIIEKVHTLWPPTRSRTHGRHGDWRRLLHLPGDPHGLPALGHLPVLVVSGMNVTILALVTFWFLRRVGVSDLIAGTVTVILMMAYAFLTALGAPVWRATLMLALYLGARLLYREKSMLNAIGAAALSVMIFNPRILFGPSFQLTFLCVWLVAAAGAPILERTTQPFARGSRHVDSISYDFVLPARVVQFRLDVRMVAGRLQRFWETVFRCQRSRELHAHCWQAANCCGFPLSCRLASRCPWRTTFIVPPSWVFRRTCW